MPYYVYAIHTDQTNNRLYEKYPDFKSAEKMEKEMIAGNHPGDNYFVKLIPAKDDMEAAQIADSLRPFPKKKK